ncbi:hypothetical protein STANM309S_06008 [Streptomyces tanashiensis]
MTPTGPATGTLYARLRDWFRAHPLAFDATIAAGALVSMIAGSFTDPHGSPDGPTFGAPQPRRVERADHDSRGPPHS